MKENSKKKKNAENLPTIGRLENVGISLCLFVKINVLTIANSFLHLADLFAAFKCHHLSLIPQ